jgi:hypothetical protein
MPGVFCIGAADGYGVLAHSTPRVGKQEKFSTLGIAVEVATRSESQDVEPHGTKMRADGSSIATPIAAGIAALFLEYLRQHIEIQPTSRGEYIRRLFLNISGSHSSDHYRFLAPWNLLDITDRNVPDQRWEKVKAVIHTSPGIIALP